MPDRGPIALPQRATSPLTGQLQDCPRSAAENAPAWVRAIADGLSAAGFTARLDDVQSVQAVTITVRPVGRREADIILDEDGYAELRWWPGPDATPAEVTDVITRLLTVVAAPACKPPRSSRRARSL